MARKLTAKQSAFVREYLIDLNAKQAAIRAGFSAKTAEQQGYQLLQHPSVQAAIAEAMAKRANKLELTADRVLLEAARLALFDPRKLLNNDGTPTGIHELDDDTAAAIAGLDVLEQYEGTGKDRKFVGYVKKYRIADKNAALERVFKHMGLFEKDNRQKGSAVESLLQDIAANQAASGKPPFPVSQGTDDGDDD